MSVKLISFGDANVDLIATVDSLPEKGEEIPMSQFEFHSGGSAANTATAAQTLGVESSFIGRVGKGLFSRFLVNEFEERGVEIKQLQRDDELSSGVMFVLITPDGERTMFSDRGANTRTDPKKIDFDYLKDAEYLHVSGYAFISSPQREAGRRIVEEARKKGLKISLDPSVLGAQEASGGIMSVLSQVDLLFLSRDELKVLSDEKDREKAAENLLEAGPSTIAMKLGEEGSLALTEDVRSFSEAFPTEVSGTTGAGDVFNAAFIAGLDRGWDLHKVNRFANAAGAISITELGARTRLPTFEEVESFLKRETNGNQ